LKSSQVCKIKKQLENYAVRTGKTESLLAA